MTTARRWISGGVLGLLLGASVQAQLETVWQQPEMSGAIGQLILLPDGSGMLAEIGGDYPSMIGLWRLPEGDLLHRFPGRLGSQHALSRDGEWLLTVGSQFYVWRLADRSLAYSIEPPVLGQGTASIRSVALTPDGARIIASLSGCEYYEPTYGCYEYLYALVCLQVSNGAIVWERVVEDYSLDLLAISPDGRWLIASGDGVQLLNTQTGELFYELSTAAVCAAFSPDSRQFALGNTGGTITLHRVEDGVVTRTLPAAHQDWVTQVAFSPDGTRLVSVGWDDLVRVWNLSDGTLIRSLRPHSRDVSAALFAGNDRLLTAGSEGRRDGWSAGSIKLWQLSDGTLLRIWTGHSSRMRQLAFSADGERLATAGRDGRLYLWRTSDGTVLQQLFTVPEERELFALSFAPDGRTLAGGGLDGVLRLWDVNRGGIPLYFLAHSGGITSLRYSPDGSLIISGGFDRQVKLWNASTQYLVRTLSGHLGGVTALDLSPNGSLVASASYDGTVRLWQTSTGALIRVFTGHTGVVWAVAFSPDGSLLFSGGADGTLRVWDVGTGVLLRSWQAHPGGVYQMALDPTGHLLASSGEDGVLRFWNAHTGALLFIADFPANARPVSFAFSPTPPYFGYLLQWWSSYSYSYDSMLVLARVRLPGDIDGNGCVDDSDLLRLLFAFGRAGSGIPEDINRDGVVDDTDLIILLFNWETGC